MRTSRNYRRRNIVIAPQLVQQYDSICSYYKIPNADTSVVFNLCLDTVARGLGNLIKKQREEAALKEQSNGPAIAAIQGSTGSDTPDSITPASEPAI